jgi:hypothetical protein
MIPGFGAELWRGVRIPPPSQKAAVIGFEPRRGGRFIIEVEQRTGETPTRFFVGRTGNIETLTR